MRTYEEQCTLVPTLMSESSQLRLTERADGIDAIIDMHETNKSEFMRELGFTERPWRFTTQGGPEHTIRHYQKCAEIIKKLLPEDFLEHIGDNFAQVLADNNMKIGKHEYKLSKYILQRVTSVSARSKAEWVALVDAMDAALIAELGAKIDSGQLLRTTVAPRFVQAFFSAYKASANGQRLELSFELEDILDAGLNEHNWGSCFKWGGINERGSMHVACSNKGGVIRSYGSDGQLVGRAWIFATDDSKSIHVFRPYGFLPGDLVAAAAKFFANKISPTHLWVPGLLKGHDNGWQGSPFMPDVMRAMLPDSGKAVFPRSRGWYGDPCILRMYREDAFGKDCSMAITLDSPPCPLCGDKHTGSYTMCKECRRTRFTQCRMCGSSVRVVDPAKASYTHICPSCEATYSVCTSCDRAKIKAEVVDGVCDACRRGRTCALCGATKNIARKGYTYLCSECLEACSLTTCYVCEKDLAHDTGAVLGGKRLCRDCLTVVLDANFVNRVVAVCNRHNTIDGRLLRAIETSLKVNHHKLDGEFKKSLDGDVYTRVVVPCADADKKSTHWSPKHLAGFSDLKPSAQLTRFCHHTNLIRRGR